MTTVVYFTRKNSIYNKLDCDCYDIERNALTTISQEPAIYHPPCRMWGKLRKLAKGNVQEKSLALWALKRVRMYGGILEHPSGSNLFGRYCIMPGKGYDNWGGFSIAVSLHQFGFPALKKTYLYVVGCKIKDLPKLPLNFDAITRNVCNSRSKNGLKEVSKTMRESTPEKMAKWLIEVINIIKLNNK